MVFRRRSGSNIRPVHRIKHVVDAQFSVSAGAQSNGTIIESIDAPVLANVQEVETGCTVNGLFVTVEVYATTAAALANCYFIIGKNPGGNITNPLVNTVGSNDNKRFVFHQEMVMLEQKVNGNPRTLFKGVIAIPRVYRRMAINDKVYIAIGSPGVNIFGCFQVHYKEFR